MERDVLLESSITNKLNEMKEELFSTLKSERIDHLHMLRTLLLGIAEEGSKVEKQQRILLSLKFDAIKARHNRIREAHRKTFEWIFTKPESVIRSRCALLDWLQSGNGIFWISGKAGSGKSTFMKFLCDHAATKDTLHHWAEIDTRNQGGFSGISAETLRHQLKNERGLVIASHFFWGNGNQMQKSQEGLLQTLLYDVLRQCPELIELICPGRWDADGLYNEIDDTWTLKELAEAVNALQNLPLLSRGMELKFCFFIDGLDEYKGEHRDIINILQCLVTSAKIKICASSRPWNVFEDAFGQSPQTLILQDLTREDIREYVHDILQEDHNFKKMQSIDDQFAELVQEIIDKASGVFLWVRLVVVELLKSVQNEDGIHDLRRRLRSLPSDLEEYFQRIFDSIDPFYQQQTSQILQVCVRAYQPLPITAFSIFDHDDPDYALTTSVYAMDLQDIESAQKTLRRRLGGRCRDLVEVLYIPTSETYIVEFIHRTVKDFLSNENMREMLLLRSGPDFNTLATLGRVCLLLIKKFPVHRSEPFIGATDSRGRLKFRNWIKDLLTYVHDMEFEQSQTDYKLLEELDHTISKWVEHGCQDWAKLGVLLDPRDFRNLSGNKAYSPFIGLAAAYDLGIFIKEKVGRDPWQITFSTEAFGLLDSSFRSSAANAKLLSFVLDVVASPEATAHNASPWFELLRWLFTVDPRDDYFRRLGPKLGILLKHIERMINNGGAQNVWVKIHDLQPPRDRGRLFELVNEASSTSDPQTSGAKVLAIRTAQRISDSSTEQIPILTYDSWELMDLDNCGDRIGSPMSSSKRRPIPTQQREVYCNAVQILEQVFGEACEPLLAQMSSRLSADQIKPTKGSVPEAEQVKSTPSRQSGLWSWFSRK